MQVFESSVVLQRPLAKIAFNFKSQNSLSIFVNVLYGRGLG